MNPGRGQLLSDVHNELNNVLVNSLLPELNQAHSSSPIAVPPSRVIV